MKLWGLAISAKYLSSAECIHQDRKTVFETSGDRLPCGAGSAVDQILESLARGELHGLGGFDLDGFARRGIAPRARGASARTERAEADQLHRFSLGDCNNYVVDECID